MTEHTNKQFDADLESVRSQFLQMGGVVAVSYTHLTLPTNREV